MNFKAVAVRCVASTTTGQLVNFVSSFSANLFLVRLVGVPIFGELAVASALVEILAFMASFAVNQAVIQYAEDGDRALAAAVALSLALSGMVAVVGLVACIALRHVYGGPVALFAAWLFGSKALQMLTSPYLMLYERHFEYFRLAMLRFGAAAVANWTAVVIAWQGWSAGSLIVRGVAPDFLTFAFVLVFIVPNVGLVKLARKAERSQLMRAFTFGVNVWALRSLEQVLYNIDVLLIKYWFPSSSGYLLGCYNQAGYIAGLPNALASSLSQTVAYRLYTATKASGQHLTAIVNGITRIVSRGLIPFTLVLLLCPEELLRLLYGEVWIGAAPMLRILGVYSIVVAVYSNLRSLLVAMGHWRDLYRIYLVAFVTYIGLMCSPLNQNIYTATAIFVLALIVVLVMTWFSAGKIVSLDLGAALRVPASVGIGSAALLLVSRSSRSPLHGQPLLNLLMTFIVPTIAIAIADRQLIVQGVLALFNPMQRPLADLASASDH